MAAHPCVPIFVVGFQRSGTTLLQALLGAHPQIAAPPEMYFAYRISDHADYFGDLSDDRNLRATLHEALHPPVDLLADCGFDEDEVFLRAKQAPRTYGGLFDAIMSSYAAARGKKRWSDKSPGQPIDSALELCPSAQVLHIVRDPRDVVASSLHVPWADGDAAALARSWRAFTLRNIRRGLELGPSQFLQIRYEDLVRDPVSVLQLVCTFLGEDYDPAMVDNPSLREGTVPKVARGWQAHALDRITPAREGRWRTRLSRWEQVQVTAAVGPMLGALGYEAPSVRTKAAATPLAFTGAVRRLASRARRARPPMQPEERYRQARRFIEGRAELLRVSGQGI